MNVSEQELRWILQYQNRSDEDDEYEERRFYPTTVNIVFAERNGPFIIIHFREVLMDGKIHNGYRILLMDAHMLDYIEDLYNAIQVSRNQVMASLPSVSRAFRKAANMNAFFAQQQKYGMLCEKKKLAMNATRNEITGDPDRLTKKFLLTFPGDIELTTRHYPGDQPNQLACEFTQFEEKIEFGGQTYKTFHGCVYWDIAIVGDRVIESNEQTTGARKLAARLASLFSGFPCGSASAVDTDASGKVRFEEDDRRRVVQVNSLDNTTTPCASVTCSESSKEMDIDELAEDALIDIFGDAYTKQEIRRIHHGYVHSLAATSVVKPSPVPNDKATTSVAARAKKTVASDDNRKPSPLPGAPAVTNRRGMASAGISPGFESTSVIVPSNLSNDVVVYKAESIKRDSRAVGTDAKRIKKGKTAGHDAPAEEFVRSLRNKRKTQEGKAEAEAAVVAKAVRTYQPKYDAPEPMWEGPVYDSSYDDL